MYISILAQMISYNEAIWMTKDFCLSEFLETAHCYGFSEIYLSLLIDYSSILDHHHIADSIYLCHILLGWNDICTQLVKLILGPKGLAYLEKIKELTYRQYKMKLLNASSYRSFLEEVVPEENWPKLAQFCTEEFTELFQS